LVARGSASGSSAVWPSTCTLSGGGFVSAITAFSVSGIRVNIDRTWFVAFFLFAWMLSAGYFPTQVPDYRPFTYWFFGTLSSLLLFSSVLIHELSHCVVARRLGIPVRQITLFIFGGVSEMAQTQSTSPATEFKITIAGPASSVGLGVIFWALAYFADGVERIFTVTLQYLSFVNFLLAAFNLIPGFPLDGGRVLRSYLWSRYRDLRRATRTAAQVGGFFALGLMGWGLAALLTMHIIPGIWLILIGLFLRRSAQAEYESSELRYGLKDIHLREIMAPPVSVHTDMPISEFITDYVFRYHHRSFPVLENGRFAGMIDVRSMKGTRPEQWPFQRVGDYLASESSYCVLDPEIDASDALRILTTQNCSKAPVVRDAALLGLLTRADLYQIVTLKTELAA
jgi:Zn-dependent protease